MPARRVQIPQVLNAALLATTFPYSPGLPRLLYDLDMPRYYRKCELRGPGLRLMEKSKTLFMFHPHGILSAGFSVNGCWSKDFNALACEKDLDTQPSSNTLFAGLYIRINIVTIPN